MSTKEVSKPRIDGAGKVIPCGDEWAIVVNRKSIMVQAYTGDFTNFLADGWHFYLTRGHPDVKQPHIHVYRAKNND